MFVPQILGCLNLSECSAESFVEPINNVKLGHAENYVQAKRSSMFTEEGDRTLSIEQSGSIDNIGGTWCLVHSNRIPHLVLGEEGVETRECAVPAISSPRAPRTDTLVRDDIVHCSTKVGIHRLEDANVPMSEDVFFAMSPATKSGLLGIDRYTSSEFNRGGGANIITGEFGDIYGLRCWQSTNVEGTNAAGHDNAIYHRDAMALAWRVKPMTQNFDDIDTLSHQTAIQTIFGVVEVRDDHGCWVKGP